MTTEKPTALPVLFENIPMELKLIPRFCLWKFMQVGEGEQQKWSKIPMQVNGHRASSTNPDTWTDFLTAQNTYEKGGFDGIGFVFTGDDDLVGIDIDDCIDLDTTEINEFAQDILSRVQGYAEISPSGTGLKIFTRAGIQKAHVDHAKGLEIYPKSRYFTITGHKLGGSIPTDLQDVTSIVPARTLDRDEDAFSNYTPPVDGWDLARVDRELLSQLDPDCHYDLWREIGMALHHQFQGDVEALNLWDTWSEGSPKYVSSGVHACHTKWSTFKGNGTTLRSLIFRVNQQKLQTALNNGETVLDNGNPLQHARHFLDALYAVEGGYKLVHYAGEFFLHVRTHYEEIEEATLRSKIYGFLDKCKKQNRQGDLIPFVATPAIVNGVLDAVAALVHLANHPNTKPPVWLDGYASKNPPAEKLVSLKNGLFQMDQAVLFPHNIGFFTMNSLPFDYDRTATCPTWMQFLDQVWGDDPDSIDLLQEYFGYILSGDSTQQKFLNIIGPRRSGKGTINKVLVDLLGQHNTVAPQLEELCDTFGLQPWLNKLLASFTDARAPERNRSAVVSQLLRIVGGDTVTVNRKNKEAWNGYLPTRIIMYSNEVLQLTENSNALTGRMLVLKMTKSFYGHEDTELAHKLSKELSGIFLWAIEGQKRRLARGGYFVQPKSGNEYIELFSELGNPIGTFIDDALDITPDGEVDKDDLFTVYRHWANKRNIHPGTDLAFKRKFLAAIQEHRIQSETRREGSARKYIYIGIKLNEKAQTYVNSISQFEREGF